MRQAAVALVVLFLVATPALGDDLTKKHTVDAKISSLEAQQAAHRKREQQLRGEVADYTARIRALEARVGDVALRLQTLEQDLGLHQRRLDALNALFSLQSERFAFLKQQYAQAVASLERRLVDIYESDPASPLDVFLGARTLDDAVAQVTYLSDIGRQDRLIAKQVGYAKRQTTAARAKTKAIRTRVRSETAVISARTEQTRSVRDELVGARNDLAGTRQQKLTDLSSLSAQDRADAEEIDALQSASRALEIRIRAAQSQPTPGTDQTPSSAGLIWPVQGPITSPFGWRWGRMHEGIDIGVPYGTPIHAAGSGTIIYCGWEEGYGNLTVIDHGGNLATAYGHQSSIAVSCGQQVTQGQVIGYVGSTGHSTGPHLHFEVRVNGVPVDPMGYL
jgi:murein DD-endopeptidase MepM/ murein hydrolase activator NlpD